MIGSRRRIRGCRRCSRRARARAAADPGRRAPSALATRPRRRRSRREQEPGPLARGTLEGDVARMHPRWSRRLVGGLVLVDESEDGRRPERREQADRVPVARRTAPSRSRPTPPRARRRARPSRVARRGRSGPAAGPIGPRPRHRPRSRAPRRSPLRCARAAASLGRLPRAIPASAGTAAAGPRAAHPARFAVRRRRQERRAGRADRGEALGRDPVDEVQLRRREQGLRDRRAARATEPRVDAVAYRDDHPDASAPCRGATARWPGATTQPSGHAIGECVRERSVEG